MLKQANRIKAILAALKSGAGHLGRKGTLPAIGGALGGGVGGYGAGRAHQYSRDKSEINQFAKLREALQTLGAGMSNSTGKAPKMASDDMTKLANLVVNYEMIKAAADESSPIWEGAMTGGKLGGKLGGGLGAGIGGAQGASLGLLGKLRMTRGGPPRSRALMALIGLLMGGAGGSLGGALGGATTGAPIGAIAGAVKGQGGNKS